MYNYHTELIFRIDIILLYLFLAITLYTIVYVIIKDISGKLRNRRLVNIKKNVYELALSGKSLDANLCFPVISEITNQQFLDAATNRKREAVFFNESEQEILKHCFVSPERITKIERLALTSFNKWQRIEAILSLGYAQVERSVNILKKTINDKDADIAYFSIIALGQIRNPDSARALLGFLKKRNFYRNKIFSVLEAFPPEITEEVIKLTDVSDVGVRIWAIDLIGRFKAVRYQKKIEELAGDKSGEVRAAACRCLGDLGRKDSKDILVKCLSDNFWLIRVCAVQALSKVLGKECLSEVTKRINDSSLSVIDSVKDVMIEHIEAALPIIEKFLSGGDEIAKRIGIEALGVTGYSVNILKGVLVSEGKDKVLFTRLLEGLIKVQAHSGLEGSLRGFPPDDQNRLFDIIGKIDAELALRIKQNIKGPKE